jgi:hypothetical protein
MKTTKFKKMIKESLSSFSSFADQISVVHSACQNEQGISICDMLSPDMAQKLIDAGEVLRTFPDRQFRPQDIEYMTRLIAVGKREFGADNQEVLDFENAIKEIMSISGEISTAEDSGIVNTGDETSTTEERELAMESLKKEFSKFNLD